MSRKDIPNVISAIRILLVAPVAWALLSTQFYTALILFAIAGFSDALDGFLAKHYHWQSRLGTILDPLADKLLMVVCFLTLAWIGLIPMWLWYLVLVRDIIIVVGALTYHFMLGKFNLLPLWSSKINTALQVIFVVLLLVQHQWFIQLETLTQLVQWAVVISLIYSGIEYISVWGLRAWQQMNNKQ